MLRCNPSRYGGIPRLLSGKMILCHQHRRIYPELHSCFSLEDWGMYIANISQTLKPIGTTPGFNNLSPSQMDALPAHPVPPSNHDGGAWSRYVKFDDVALHGWVPPPTRGSEYEMMRPDEFMDDKPFIYLNEMVNAEMLSLWSDAPATFR